MISSPKKIKNIIFDFGGVLFDIDYKAPIKAFQQLGFGSFEEIYAQSSQNPVFDLFETGKMSNDDFLHYLKSFVPEVTNAQLLEAWNCILLGLIQENIPVVEKAREMGLRTFILSNTNAIHVPVFENMIDERIGWKNFRSLFEEIVYSNVIGMRKPHAETFLSVCQTHQLNPDETLFIDDSRQHVEGASKAGLQTIHLPEHSFLRLLVEPYL